MLSLALKKSKRILPGFGMTLGFTIFYLSFLLLIPLSAVVIRATGISWNEFWNTVTDTRVLASYRLSFGGSFAAALINTFFGLIVAWVICRYKFPGRRIIDALVDLPFALPTAVAGISLTTIFSAHGWLGKYLEPMGIKIVFNEIGVIIALTFVGLPFVVRTIQPVLLDLDKEIEEAAASLAATRFQTLRKVILPELKPALITGFTLSFARSLGEYGSVVFISGNIPMKTEITPLLIMSKLEQYDYTGAVSIAIVMLAASFLILLTINIIQWYSKKRKV